MNRVPLLATVALLAALLGRPAPLSAAAAGHGAADEASAAATKTAHGDDKLDVFKGALDLTVWSIVVFLILFLLLARFAWPPIREGLDKRERSIAHDKLEAERAKREAAEMRTRLDAELAKANAEIRQMMDKARQDAAATAAEELARGKAELQAERERLQRELRLSTDDALHRIWHDAAQLATTISAKVVRKNLSVDDHRALVREALDEFQAADKSRLQEIGGTPA